MTVLPSKWQLESDEVTPCTRALLRDIFTPPSLGWVIRDFGLYRNEMISSIKFDDRKSNDTGLCWSCVRKNNSRLSLSVWMRLCFIKQALKKFLLFHFLKSIWYSKNSWKGKLLRFPPTVKQVSIYTCENLSYFLRMQPPFMKTWRN